MSKTKNIKPARWRAGRRTKVPKCPDYRSNSSHSIYFTLFMVVLLSSIVLSAFILRKQNKLPPFINPKPPKPAPKPTFRQLGYATETVTATSTIITENGIEFTTTEYEPFADTTIKYNTMKTCDLKHVSFPDLAHDLVTLWSFPRSSVQYEHILGITKKVFANRSIKKLTNELLARLQILHTENDKEAANLLICSMAFHLPRKYKNRSNAGAINSFLRVARTHLGRHKLATFDKLSTKTDRLRFVYAAKSMEIAKPYQHHHDQDDTADTDEPALAVYYNKLAIEQLLEIDATNVPAIHRYLANAYATVYHNDQDFIAGLHLHKHRIYYQYMTDSLPTIEILSDPRVDWLYEDFVPSKHELMNTWRFMQVLLLTGETDELENICDFVFAYLDTVMEETEEFDETVTTFFDYVMAQLEPTFQMQASLQYPT